MHPLAGLSDELERSAPAQAAMAMLEHALNRRSVEERHGFWRAVEIYCVSRKAPPKTTAASSNAGEPAGYAVAATPA